MVAQVREVAGIAAQLHHNLSATTPTDDAIFGTFVHSQSMAARALTRLDKHVGARRIRVREGGLAVRGQHPKCEAVDPSGGGLRRFVSDQVAGPDGGGL
eukprot:5128870-Pyramimonas_sp.AAC.1